MGTSVIFCMQVEVISFTDRNQGTIISSKVSLGLWLITSGQPGNDDVLLLVPSLSTQQQLTGFYLCSSLYRTHLEKGRAIRVFRRSVENLSWGKN